MRIPEFLTFERKKIILPVVLAALLTFVLVMDAIYAEQTKEEMSTIRKDALDVLKLVVYNGSLNGTDENIEKELIEKSQSAESYQSDVVPIIQLKLLSSYYIEYFLNAFGTNFCPSYLPFDAYELSAYPNVRSDCISTKLEIESYEEFLNLVTCTAYVTSTYGQIFYNNSEHNSQGSYFLSEESIQKNREIVYSDQIGKTIREHEYCKYPEDVASRQEKLNEFISANENSIRIPFLSKMEKPAKIILITPVYIALFYLILAAVGYLISSAILWAHRKNYILKGEGKKVCAVVTAMFFLILYGFFQIKIIDDIRLMLIFAVVFAYLATTIIWQFFRKSKLSAVLFIFLFPLFLLASNELFYNISFSFGLLYKDIPVLLTIPVLMFEYFMLSFAWRMLNRLEYLSVIALAIIFLASIGIESYAMFLVSVSLLMDLLTISFASKIYNKSKERSIVKKVGK